MLHRPFVAMPDHADSESFEQRTAKRGRAENFPAMVRYLDTLVGRVLEVLRSEGLEENTIVIFTADNGTDNASEASTLRSRYRGREVRGGKYYPTELGVDVPLLVRWPGVVQAGSVSRALTDLSDFRPTFCQLAGAALPGDIALDGRSLVPVLTGEVKSHREWIYTYGNFDRSSKKYKRPEQFPDGFIHCVRDQRWKYGSDGRLFDLETDPFEEQPLFGNISEEAVEAKQRLETVLERLRNSTPRRW
jgi:arylsulfatase A